MRSWTAFLCLMGMAAAPLFGGPPRRDANTDRKAITNLENEWLHARDAQTLDRVLAPDFLHPLPTGMLATKEQQISWFSTHPPPPGRTVRFEMMKIRLYGDVAVVNGIVEAKDSASPAPRRTIFTDVFSFRDDRWQAVNAEENQIESAGTGSQDSD
jgi:Domain of unknown function (DUF4440)